ncbi:MAG TPA: hypothetical protein VG432_08365 [Gemmatimonadaceae bacterium]|nr:hypothetical protein [Gemmatimonadaceae bacterium]
MRPASCTLLLAMSLLSAPLAAQVRVNVNVTPPAPPAPGVERVQIIRGAGLNDRGRWPDSLDARELKLLTDSITLLANEITKAQLAGDASRRLGQLQGRLGALEGRLGALHGRLGSLQGRPGRMEVRVGDLPQPPVPHAAPALSPKQLTKLLKQVSSDPHGAKLPPQDSIVRGNFAVGPAMSVGRVASLGTLDVFGTVNGDAVALDGDVIVHRGAHVTGDALSIGGTVRLDGGTVDGEMRSLDRAVTPTQAAAASSSGFLSILDQLQRTMGALVVMVLLGFGAMVFAEDRLRVVSSAIETRFGKSLFAGILTEVSFIPALVLAVVLLVITIIGVILLPVAIPGMFVVGALLTVLGFLAVSRVAGQALTRRAATVSVRGAELRSMLAGLFFFFGLWVAAAVLNWVPVLGSLLHALAFVVTWAAATVGLGAAVITRGGGRPATVPVVAAPEGSELGWQTPTPISGIAAARRQATNTPEV